LGKIAKELDFELVMVTNQDGLGTDSFPEETFWPAQEKMITALANEGIRFSEILIDRSFPEDHSPNRKPRTGLLPKYVYGDYDLENSYVIGDRETDVELAENLGCRGIYLGKDFSAKAFLSTSSWEDIYLYLKNTPRKSTVTRKTNETEIEISLNLDGSGKNRINTGLGFFDHMLEQIAKHGQLDLQIEVRGDLNVDEHHTIEDVALALGEAIQKAMGSKKGMERYGFTLPMDDCLAQVALDFGGRPWLVWKAEFERERVGDMPTEMFYHFFKSLSDAALCNLNIQAEGKNEHHKIECIFKAFGRAVKQAVRKNSEYSIPSTKGVL
jgi:imidazoleglycerol-phosphate dehydratase/histidinol-phosphatase